MLLFLDATGLWHRAEKGPEIYRGHLYVQHPGITRFFFRKTTGRTEANQIGAGTSAPWPHPWIRSSFDVFNWSRGRLCLLVTRLHFIQVSRKEKLWSGCLCCHLPSCCRRSGAPALKPSFSSSVIHTPLFCTHLSFPYNNGGDQRGASLIIYYSTWHL